MGTQRPPAWRLTIALGIALALPSCTPDPPAPSEAAGPQGATARATVERVIDGDTVDLQLPGSGTERARLLGIDTPESVKPDTPVECFAAEASERAKELLPVGTTVLVSRDVEARDRYGRLLVYVWRESDGLFVNQVLVEEGFARTLSIEPNTTYRSDLAAAAATARRQSIGLWASCPLGG